MMHPREWKFGKHIARWEAPDVLWMRIDGDNGLEETLPMVRVLKELGEQEPFFVLADFKAAGALEPEARRHISVMRQRIHFSSSEEQARDLLVQLRGPAESLFARD